MNLVHKLALLIVMGAFTGSAYALPMIQTAACINDATATCVTGIYGLEILDETFNVTFGQLSYLETFEMVDPYFLDNPVGAQAASTSMFDALIPLVGSEVAGIIGLPTGCRVDFGPICLVLTPFSDSVDASRLLWYADPFIPFLPPDPVFGFPPERFLDASNPLAYHTWAIISVIPAPTTMALFCLGLAGIGFSCRKRILHGWNT